MVPIPKNQIHLRRQREKTIQSHRIPSKPLIILLHGVQRLLPVRAANPRRNLKLRPQQNDHGHSEIHRAVYRASHRALLCVSSLLRALVVSGRVLVLQCVHSIHAGLVRVHASSTAAPQHAADSSNGQQNIQNNGVQDAQMDSNQQR